ncbi:BTAD domain-containing putative transcriptional regulator [Streptomyces antimycoticus]|uniref:AfsR/SARP family transcriptional regulator n=1 Tax=Streptomyces antimycoticus TaxID=68175 RepID=UPI0034436ABA
MVSFGLLGSVEVRVDGTEVNLGHARQQCVLVALLVDANHVVAVDQLVDRVWGERPPRRAQGTLYSYLSRLRQALAPAAEQVSIVRRSGGYVLSVEETAVDLHLFRQLVGQARAADEDERASDLFAQALGLWRGRAFTALDTPWFTTLREALERERTAAELDHTDVRLRMGRHTGLLAELSTRSEAHPLDERLAGQFMVALYRSGRPAQALHHYQEIRCRLAEELGTDPSPPLRDLHQRILTADPALTAPATPSTDGSGRRPVPVPRQLPAAPPVFIGRLPELATLDRLLDSRAAPGGTVMVSAIGGVGGVGKSWLVLHWAHNRLDHFPDGQLYINLRGFDPSGEPLAPAVAVRGFLDALGVDPAEIPAELDGQTGLYRSLTSDKRLLIVLDNACDTAQLLPLLPGSSTCTVLITSRRQLTGLAVSHGARSLDLDVLPDTEARHLLIRHLGHRRTAAEPDAVATLLKYCAGLPLAISILAARAAASPDLPLAALAEEVQEAATRLDALDTGDMAADLRAVFSSSYHALEPDTAQAFRLIGLAPGPDISVPATASLTGLPVARVRVLLRKLRAAHLVQEHTPGRHRMHDLIRLYATEQGHGQPVSVSEAALHRLADFYLHTAHTAAGLLDAHQDQIPLAAAQPGVVPEEMADHGAALDWFTAEHRVLYAAVDLAAGLGLDAHAWQLARALETFFDYRGHLHDWAASQRTALKAARRLGERSWQAGAHRSLGVAYTQMGRLDEGHTHFHQALDLYDHLGDRVSQAHTYRGLGWVCDRQGRPREALDHNERALRLYRGADHRGGQAMALNNAGWLHAMLGQYERTLDYCTQAVALNREIDDRHAEAGAWDSLGYAHHHLARYADATGCYERALDLVRGVGDRFNETEILHHLGDTRLAAGDHEAARLVWRQALEIAEEIGHPAADELRDRLMDPARDLSEDQSQR